MMLDQILISIHNRSQCAKGGLAARGRTCVCKWMKPSYINANAYLKLLTSENVNTSNCKAITPCSNIQCYLFS